VANILLAHLEELELDYPEVDLPVDALRARILDGDEANSS
jgi:hypothetical protein